MFTQQEQDIIEFGKKNGKTRDEVMSALTKYRQSQTTQTATQKPVTQQQAGVLDSVKETVGDVTDTVLGIGKSFVDTYNRSMDVVENKNFNPLQKFMGVAGSVAGGVSGAIGEAVTGAGKIALSQDSEDKLKEITGKVAQGVAQTDTAKSIIDWYGKLNENDKLFVDSVGGVASLMSDVYAPGVAKAGAKPVISGTKTALQSGKQVIETGLTATKPALSKAADIGQGTLDVGRGVITQTKDFGKRIVVGAKDAGEESRRLASLPPAEAKLIRTGVDDAGIKLLKESTQEEIGVYKELIQQAKVKSGDMLAKQPKEIAGREFMKPVKHLLTVRNSVGAKLGAVRQKLSNTPMDVTPQWREFRAYLDGKGITVDKNGKFTGSGTMAKGDLQELQKLYTELRPDKNGKVMRSQKWLDEWNQRTYKEYDIRQAREQTFGDDVTKTVEKARGIFKQAMPKEYRVYSQQYSEAMKPIGDVVKLLGYKGDVTKLTAKELKASEVAMRVLGNASARPQEVIDAVINTAKKYGYTSKVDLNKVTRFADALEDIYPAITPTRGFTGSATRGVNQSVVGVAGDVATGNVKGVLGQALGSSATQKEIQQALDEFIASLGQ